MPTQPRVALSMLTLVPGGMGGSETYARELLRELSGRNLDLRALVAATGAGFAQGVEEAVAPEFPTGNARSTRARALLLSTFRRQRLRARIAGADVVHYPFTVAIPPAPPGSKVVVTLLDVQHHDLPRLFTRAERVYRDLTYDRAARRADAVVTISNFCKGRIVHHLGIEPTRVHVAHLGVRPKEFTPRLGPREPFLLYPAKGWPHKNHSTLLTAFRALRARQPGLRLVLTGLDECEVPAPVPDGVEVRGLVSREHLVDLYRRAAVMVFPSRYEGFGLPVVEAMASGCPVAAARSGALPEVVGDAGVLFDADDPDDIARGVEEALDTSAELQRRGLARSAQFGWDTCADVHERLYRSVAAREA